VAAGLAIGIILPPLRVRTMEKMARRGEKIPARAGGGADDGNYSPKRQWEPTREFPDWMGNGGGPDQLEGTISRHNKVGG